MRLAYLSVLVGFLCAPLHLMAHAVISEVMWPGSDLSSADEWLELGSISPEAVDLTGWTVTSLKSSGEEEVVARFMTGTVLEPGSFLIIAHFNASESRLLAQPALVSTSLTLPNTKLLLKLKDASGTVIDTAGDGAGAPFAGSNPSGGVGRASMERTTLELSGIVKENWRTARESKGFDHESSVLGTPGFGPESVADPNPPPTCQNSSVGIGVQEGSLVGVGKTTVNFQAVALSGSMIGVACNWNFSDGFRSTSCNPPPHAFTEVGTTIVALEAVNQCGNTLTQEQKVEVLPHPGSLPDSEAKTFDGSRLILFSALPNPEGADTGKEWIEIKNVEDKSVSLEGYKIRVGDASLRTYGLKGTVGPRERLKIFSNEVSFTLPNSKSKLELLSPSGDPLSSIIWQEGEEKRVFFTEDIRKYDLRVRFLEKRDDVSFLTDPGEMVTALLSPHTLVVRLLGVTSNPESLVTGFEMNKKISREEFMGALMKDQILELEFDTELWDSSGNLLSYVIVPSFGSVQERLLLSGGWNAERALEYKKKEHFIALERPKSHGPILIEVANATATSSQIKAITGASIFPVNIRITEVYPSPFPDSGTGELALTGEEWVEIENYGQESVSLDQWYLKVNSKKKELPKGLNVSIGQKLLVRTKGLKLALKNDGTSVELLSPDGIVRSTVTYPPLKHGLAYALDILGNFCITTTPTPGDLNVCTAITKKVRRSAAATTIKKTTTKKVSPQVRKYASDYKAQAQSHTLEFPEERAEESPGFLLAILSFLFGALAAGVSVFYFFKKPIGQVSSQSP